MNIRLCDECNSNPANVHLTQIVQNEVIVKHLCEECAKKRGISIVIEDGHLDLPQVVKKHKKGTKIESNPENDLICPVCRMRFCEFKEKGRLGCPNCYIAFEKEINALLIQVHGASQHRGKKYHRLHGSGRNIHDISVLRHELNNAIRDEKFELAALIRDKINSVSLQKSTDTVQE